MKSSSARISSLSSGFAVFMGSMIEFDVYAYCAYTGLVSIEFDPKKDAANLKKHGVSLSEGDRVLNDPLAQSKIGAPKANSAS